MPKDAGQCSETSSLVLFLFVWLASRSWQPVQSSPTRYQGRGLFLPYSSEGRDTVHYGGEGKLTEAKSWLVTLIGSQEADSEQKLLGQFRMS